MTREKCGPKYVVMVEERGTWGSVQKIKKFQLKSAEGSGEKCVPVS